MNFVDILFASLLANHLLFFHFFGVGEFLTPGSTRNLGPRTLGLTVLLVAATVLWWVPDYFVLQAFHLEFLRTLLLLVVLWTVTTLWSLLRKSLPGPWPQAREFLLHSFLVGGVLLVGSSSPDLFEVMVAATAAGLGYGAALVLLAAVESRLARETIPRFIQGLPLQLITLGMVWLILQGLGFAFAGKGA